MMKLVHPDLVAQKSQVLLVNFSHKSTAINYFSYVCQEEQAAATSLSSLANMAMDVLSHPVQRANYLVCFHRWFTHILHELTVCYAAASSGH